jgi:photosystem II stability/assembly factor-like uncharacterized protein
MKSDKLFPTLASYLQPLVFAVILTLSLSVSSGYAKMDGAHAFSPSDTTKKVVTVQRHTIHKHTVRKQKTVKRHYYRKHKKVTTLHTRSGGIDMPPPGSNGEEVNRSWYEQRAWPNAEIPADAYMKALEEARKIPVFGMHGKYSTESAHDWQLLGPTSIGGRVTSLAVVPGDSNLFYAGAASGGLWKTRDHGRSWVCVTDTFAALPIGAVTIDPRNPQIIYIGQGESNFSGDCYPGNGIWQTVDAGTTWHYLGLAKTQYITKILLDPTNSSTIYVAAPGPNSSGDTNRGVFKTTDLGATWSHVLSHTTAVKTSATLPVVDLVMNPHDNNDLIAATMDRRTESSGTLGGQYTGLWHTLDGGAHWHRIDTIAAGIANGWKLKNLSRGALYWSDSSGKSVLYAAFSKSDVNAVTGFKYDVNFYGLYRTTNPDTAWQQLQDTSLNIPYGVLGPDSVNVLYRQGDYNFYLAGNPLRPNELYIGGIDVIRSIDGGRTFNDITIAYPRYFRNDRTQHSDQHALAFTSSATGADLLVGSDGGVFHTDDFGANWEQLKGMPITMFYAVEPWRAGMKNTGDFVNASDLKIFGGTQDNGSVGHGFSANNDWDWINRGDGGVAISHPTDPAILFTSIQLGRLYMRSSLDSLHPNFVYDQAGFGTQNLTTKWHELTWLLLKGPNHLTDTTEPVTFIPPSVLDGVTGTDLYTARLHIYHAKINYTDPQNTMWSLWSPTVGGNLTSPKSWGSGDLGCLALGVRDAANRPMLWTGGTMVASGSYTSSLWRTTVDPLRSLDSAPVWIRATGNLPAAYVTAICPDRTDSLTAFCTTSGYGGTGHVFKTTDGGKTWKSVSGNLPAAPFNALVIDTFAENSGGAAAKNECLIAASDVGVFVTTDAGATWSTLGANLPHLVVGDIKLYKNQLIAGTHGRSAWAIDVSDLRAVHASVGTNGPIAQASGFRIIGVSPNPVRLATQSTLQIYLAAGEHPSQATLELVNAESGIAIASKQLSTTASVAEFALDRSLASGAYIIRLLDAHGAPVSSQRILIIK